MSQSVKPCPFCGTMPKIVSWGEGLWDIYCANGECLMSVGTDDWPKKADAIKAWNTRKGEKCQK